MILPIIKGAMGVSWTMLSSSLSKMVALIPRKIILTKPGMADVTNSGLVCLVSFLEILNTLVLSKRKMGYNNFPCYNMQKNAKVVSIDGYEDVPENNEKALQKAVANQPVSVAIEAGGRDFQLYESVSFCHNNVLVFLEV